MQQRYDNVTRAAIIVAAVCIVLALTALAGCGTVAGIGRDLTDAAESMRAAFAREPANKERKDAP
jgi:predicted small secreted protein